MENFALEELGFVSIGTLLHCAVYALVLKGEVVYVGQTKQPWVRMYAHVNARQRVPFRSHGTRSVKTGIRFDDIWLRPCMLAELDRLEAEMIAHFAPRHNLRRPTLIPPAPELDAIVAEIVAARAALPSPYDGLRRL